MWNVVTTIKTTKLWEQKQKIGKQPNIFKPLQWFPAKEGFNLPPKL